MNVAPATYFCRRCQKPSATAICPDCYGTAVEIGEGDRLEAPALVLPPLPPLPVKAPAAPTAAPPAEPAPAAAPAVPPAVPLSASSPSPAVPPAVPPAAPFAPPLTPAFVPAFVPPATAPSATPVAPIAEPAIGLAASPGAAQLTEYLADGFEIFLVAGIGGSGKTHLMEIFRGQDQLDRVQDVGGRLMPTHPQKIEVHPIPHPRRRAIFVDTSGEHFNRLYNVAERAEGKEEIQLLDVVTRGLGGLILLFKLSEQWDPKSEGRQPRMLINILRLLRWLRGGGRLAGAGHRPLPQRVDAEVERMPTLEVPVLLLFSFADQLAGCELPPPQGRIHSPGRPIYPPGEDPLLLLHHYAPEVLAALEKNVHSFHVDFCHSVVQDDREQLFADACGVATARDWLMLASQRRPLLPTRFWLRLDRRLRPGRWALLPDARRLGE